MSRPRPRIVLGQVRHLIEVRRPVEAARLAQEALAEDPDDATLRAAVGWAHLAAGQLGTARAWLEWSLAVDPHQVWVHDLRARAILAGAGHAVEAREAVAAGLREDPEDPAALYTMVRACLASRDRDGAERAAATLAAVAPTSALAPLARACLALDRGGVLHRRRYHPAALVAAGVVSQGVVPVVLGGWWAIHVVRRAPHLREADASVREALRRDPASGTTRQLLSEILQMRFRFAGSVEGDVATAALDAGLVDARDLARSIARRTAVAGAVATVVWAAVVMAASFAVDGSVAAVVGLACALVLAGAIVALERWQTAALPPLVHRRVLADPWPLVVAVGATTLIGGWAAQAATTPATHRSHDVFVAAVGAVPVAVAFVAARGALAIRSRARLL